ncbi:MAG: Arylsulfatase [candidate division BRC1 bacterium ADurb.BinA364]|nr:MAG: Arylsulfatase [candidate division BRC1 bacterium ADurb.BinA364]
MAKPRNIIVINTDTLRADHLGCYGHPFIETPNIDRFAERSIQFNNAYMESGPTVQMRRVWFTGQSLLPYPIDLPPKGIFPPLLGWKPLRNEDVAIAETFQENGYTTGLVVDVWHFFKPNMNLHRGFDYWFLEGGHETHSYATGPVRDVDTRQHLSEAMWTEEYAKRTKLYLMNTNDYREEEYFCARTFRKTAQMAIDFAASGKPFFIWADTFVPHEPWDGRKTYWWNRYKDRFKVKSKIKEPIFFYGADMSKCTREDNDLFHAIYCGMVTELDYWVGYLLNMLEMTGLFENTTIIFTSDHGTEFMEHGQFQKHPELLHREVTQLPLLVHHPDFEDKHVEVDGLVSALDYAPTLLNLAGIRKKHKAPLQGFDFMDLARGDKKANREFIQCGYCHFGGIRTLTHNMIFPVATAEDAKTLDEILPNMALDVQHALKGPDPSVGVRLYDTVKDRGEQKNIYGKCPQVEKQLKAYGRSVWPNAPKLQD